ncbi:MAG: hypothetical protein LBI28_07220 [Treponema sp.]|jgi:lipopolysaccharide biosynthesis glycosyltransferase|nr:hypothetical protein [Treponema sp.]
MKYVYVLTSSQNDLYYEQFFLSVTSLRLHNPNACIVALIDSKTKDGLTGKRVGYEQVVSDTVIINAPNELSQREVSRWIKTSMKKYVTGDFLYIDCDTVIAGNIDCNFPPELKIGAILDTHVPLAKHHLAVYFEEEDKKLGFTSSFETGKRYNGGIIFCRDTPQGDDFFSKWHSLWLYSNKKGNHHDMPSLNQANYEMGGIITGIGDEWNCQITHNGLPYLYEARIIHYYATAFTFICCPFIPASDTVLSSVKESGIISHEIMELLKNPKTAFEHNSRIISGEAELDVVNSKLFSLLLRIRKKKPKHFKALNSFIIRKLSRKK